MQFSAAKSSIFKKILANKITKASAARRLGISRKTLYVWLNNYQNSNGNLKQNIFRVIVASPELGPLKIKQQLSKKGIIVSSKSIWNVLKKYELNTSLQRQNYSANFHKTRQAQDNNFPNTVRLNPFCRKRLIEDFLAGEKQKDLLVKYNLSRKTFAKWKSRYLMAQMQSGNILEALKDRHPQGSNHPRGIEEKIVKKVLYLVASNPEYSTHKIAQTLGSIGNHGVQNILERNNLSHYELRKIYSENTQLQPQPILTRLFNLIKSIWNGFIPGLAPGPPPVLKLRRAGLFSLPFEALARRGKSFLVTTIFSILFILGSFYWFRMFQNAGSTSQVLGLVLASTAFFMGTLFFLYSFKYYLTLAIVLSFSQSESTNNTEFRTKNGKTGFLAWILGLKPGDSSATEGNGHSGPVGLEPNLEHVTLQRHPYFSIHIPFYNEKNVVERAIAAATNFDYPGDYEVILCDDSTDETTRIIQEYLKAHSAKCIQQSGDGWLLTQGLIRRGVTLKHLHRSSRSGFKGGALGLALKHCNPRTEFISVFDADFVPYPDTLELFLKYFKVQNNLSENYQKSNVAAVAGYQWHVLNKSENWVTRGVRTEYAGSYVIERSGTEIYGGMKLIHGSVYAIRRDVLEEVGWATSITEDFELTLKLYNAGYKVVYTPYIQAPAECVSTLKRLIRQRMRWAEGHSYNVKKMFKSLILNPKLSAMEKLELLYLSPYYLQAFFFLIGTIAWLLSETLFPARLPFWTSLWGWSLVLTNLFALPLMNAVGLFLEESEERDYVGLASFVVLSYLLVPFQAYAALKGFLEKEEGTWFRTPKTGKITDVFTRGRFYRFISGILPGKTPAVSGQFSVVDSQYYLSLASANNQFNSFSILPRTNKWLSKMILTILLILSVTTYSATKGVPEVLATDPATTQYMGNTASTSLTGAWEYQETTDTQDTTTNLIISRNDVGDDRWIPGNSTNAFTTETKCGTPTGEGWLLKTPFGGSGGSIGAGVWTFYIYESDNATAGVGHLDVCVWDITISAGAINSSALLFQSEGMTDWLTTDIINNAAALQTRITDSQSSFTMAADHYLYIEYWLNMTTKTGSGTDFNVYLYTGTSGGTDPRVVTPTITIPENVVYLILVAPLIPYLVFWIKKKSFLLSQLQVK